jgi:hypothetical protein
VREADKRSDEAPPRSDQPGDAGEGWQAGLGTQVRPEEPAEGQFEGRRIATVNLPFIAAQFRAPELRAPARDELDAAARGARSMLPSGKSLLFYGASAVTAVAGVIEWPVAVAVGVGTALAGQGAAIPEPRGGAQQPVQAATGGTDGGEQKA